MEGVELRVENDGAALGGREGDGGRPGGGRAGSGLGLAATRARLATAYGDRASLRLLRRDGDAGGVSVRIILPRSVRSAPGDARRGELVEAS
jgi:hypothetical protein